MCSFDENYVAKQISNHPFTVRCMIEDGDYFWCCIKKAFYLLDEDLTMKTKQESEDRIEKVVKSWDK